MVPNHHYENPVLGDFSASSPKFFSARVGGVLPLLGAVGALFTTNFENLKIFEKLRFKNAIKMNFGDLLNKILFNFFYTPSNIFKGTGVLTHVSTASPMTCMSNRLNWTGNK